jgi:hypothetical protein
MEVSKLLKHISNLNFHYSTVLLHKGHPARISFRRVRPRLVHLVRSVSINGVDLDATHPTRHFRPQPFLSRPNPIPLLISQHDLKLPYRQNQDILSSIRLSVCPRQLLGPTSKGRYAPCGGYSSSPGFASHLSGRKSPGLAQTRGFWCVASVLVRMRRPSVGSTTPSSVVSEKPGMPYRIVMLGE